MTTWELSRLIITSNICVDTPSSVLLEIAGSHGIAVDCNDIATIDGKQRLIDIIYTHTTISITKLNMDSAPYLARFINYQVDWNLLSLKHCFNFMKRFLVETPVDLSWTDIMRSDIGPQTPKRTRQLNACMLYRLCLDRDIIPMSDSSLHYMMLLLELSKDSIKNLRQIVNDPGITRRVEIFRIITQISEHQLIDRITVTRSQLTHISKSITRPNNRADAIYLAFNLGIDISDSKYPIKEYFKLKTHPKKYLKQKHTTCPEINSSDITIRYNPIIPFDWYPPEAIRNFVKSSGHNYCYGNNPEEIIQLSRLMPNFYKGISPDVSNTETPIDLDIVSELNPIDVVSYGIYGQPMMVLTITELYSMFKINNCFITHNGGYYSESSINKLFTMSDDLKDLITEIRTFQNIDDTYVLNLRMVYNIQSESVKQALTELLQLAMSMRGWNGETMYPIGSSPVDDYFTLEERVNCRMVKFRDKIKSEDNWSLISLLPLRLYKSGKFIKTSDSETIIDRLITVSEGKDIKSCIRISSNWLASSVYFYQRCLLLPPSFDIANMRHIA